MEVALPVKEFEIFPASPKILHSSAKQQSQAGDLFFSATDEHYSQVTLLPAAWYWSVKEQ